MSNDLQTVNGRLRSWVESMNWSVGDFADQLGVDQPVASMYLTGVRTPGNKMQRRLRKLGADVDWIMTGRIVGKTAIVQESLAKYDVAVRDYVRMLEDDNERLKKQIAKSSEKEKETSEENKKLKRAIAPEIAEIILADRRTPVKYRRRAKT